MPVGAIVGAAGSLAGGIAGGKGASKAAKIQAQSAAQQTALLQNMYNMNAANVQPDITTGHIASDRESQLLGLTPTTGGQSITDLLRSQPGYQYRVDEAGREVNAGAAARGMFQSGPALKALQDRAYNLADQNFNTYLGQVHAVSDRGTAAASSLAGISTNYANSANTVNQTNATAQANNSLFQARNFQDTLGGVLGNLGKAFPSSYGQGGS